MLSDKNYKEGRLASIIIKKLYNILQYDPNIVERFNLSFSCNLKSREIVFTKVLQSKNGKSVTIKYFINNENKHARIFIKIISKQLIKSLKRTIKKYCFPVILFEHDKNYECTMKLLQEEQEKIRQEQ